MNTLAFFFEVMDKEPSVLDNYAFFILLGAGAFFLCRYRAWLAAVAFPILSLCLILQWAELHHPSVGDDILREAGYGYFVHCYAAMGAAVLLSLIGVVAEVRRSWLRTRFR